MRFDDALNEIAESVWATVAKLELERVIGLEPFQSDQTVVTAIVRINGAWQGAVAVSTSYELACGIAAVMFGIPGHVVGTEHVRDALGEVGQMIARNLKGQLPRPSTLSLPTVHVGTYAIDSVPHPQLVARLHYDCEGESIIVAMVAGDLALYAA